MMKKLTCGASEFFATSFAQVRLLNTQDMPHFSQNWMKIRRMIRS